MSDHCVAGSHSPEGALRALRMALKAHGDDPAVSAAVERVLLRVLANLPEEGRAWFERAFEATVKAADELGPAASAEEIYARSKELERRAN